MKPINFKEVNLKLSAPQGQEENVGELLVNVGIWENDWAGVTSVWELSPEEIEVFKKTGKIYLTLFTLSNFPVLTMNVLNPFEAGLVKPLPKNFGNNGHTETNENY